MGHLADRDFNRDEFSDLISTERIGGTGVLGADGKSLGRLAHLMIDPRDGRIAYAVIAYGGGLGIGERLHPLPWQALDWDPALDGWRAAATRGDIEGAPHSLADEGRWCDPGWRRRIDEHFAIPARRASSDGREA